MSNISSSKNNSKKNSKTIIDTILEYESVVVFGGLGFAILATIILTGMFQTGQSQRESLLFNAAGALFMGFGFIYLIITFMDSKLEIFGNKFDIGMFIYIAIVLFVMFVLGN